MAKRNAAKLKSEQDATSALPNFPALEEQVLRRWDDERIFARTLEKTKGGEPFVFFEGPPTANGKPGIHHVLARVFKDVIVRFQTMRGKSVPRKGGWDTHGLPVELQIEKKLGVSGKKEIESIVKGDKRASIAEFNALCKASVTEYIKDWELLTRRIGFWLDMDHAYRTYTNDYIETLWWIIKQMSTIETKEGPLLYRGHKVVPHCPRCETALSSHEVAQGYKTVQDTSVYIRFRVTKQSPKLSELTKGKEVFILSWTTTPWTLPGNVALAVHKAMAYTLVKQKDELLVVAKDLRTSVLGEEGEIIGELTGSELAGTSYEPLFAGAVDPKDSKTAWTVLTAPFVTATEGTGVVHTAVMYGEDDYQLGKAEGLPTEHTVDPTGHFFPQVVKFAGQFVKDEKTEKSIVEDLHERELLYKVQPYTHEYPFCWRCSTPLLYYAKDSWFVRMSSLRGDLEKNNHAINWVPSHIQQGRFGEWLKEAKDWAFSRERYWGTPLPIWQCQTCGRFDVIGSFEELKKRAIDNTLPEDTRTIHVMRHGTRDVGGIYCVIENDTIEISDVGKEQARKEGKRLKGKIDMIITSDFLRTRQTADIVAKETGAVVVTDVRLREYFVPSYEGKETKELKKQFPKDELRLRQAPEGGETLFAAAKRVQECIIDSLQRYEGKRLLFVSHGDPIWAYQWLRQGKKDEELADVPYPEQGSCSQIILKNIPINPHRPYIDDIALQCTCKEHGVMKRVEEVADVWFDSGSMPFAQSHFPFAKGEAKRNEQLRADYISEAIDQTRGWFYTLLAVSTVLGKGEPYKNVICLGHILDDKGEKMSKSKGNIVNPWDVIQETGSDALRIFLYTANQPGDSKLFNVDGVRDVVKKTFLILWNVETLYLLSGGYDPEVAPPKVTHLMDRWLEAEFAYTKSYVTKHLEVYKVFEAARRIREFITDFSTWYVRRSRGRFKTDPEARTVLGYTLLQLATLLAPFAPMYAELIFERIFKKKVDSVHLADWPDADSTEYSEKIHGPVRTEMQQVRKAVEVFLSIRKESSMKSRQPLARAWTSMKLSEEARQVIAEEINVDAVLSGASKPETDGDWRMKEKEGVHYGLDVALSPALKERGKERELLRHVNDLRKMARLAPSDRIVLFIESTDEDLKPVQALLETVKDKVGVQEIQLNIPEDVEVKRLIKLEGVTLTLALRVVS